MNWKLLSIALFVLPLLAGCPASLPPTPAELPTSKVQSAAGDAAMKALVLANDGLGVAYAFIRDGVRDQIINPTQGRAWFNNLDGYRDQLREVKRLIDAGSFDQAKLKAEGTQALIKILHDQAVAAAAKRSQETGAPWWARLIWPSPDTSIVI